MDQNVDRRKFLRKFFHHSLNGKIAVPREAFVGAGLFVHICHGVEGDVAGDHLFDFEISGPKG